MKALSLLAAMCLLTVQHALAQGFEPGYVKINQHEQVNGLIGKTISGIPELIQYKAQESAEIKTYRAGEIAGFGFDGGLYFNSFLNPGSTDAWTFVETLVDGKLTLIRRNGLLFLYDRDRNKIEFLDHHYGRTLRRAMIDCPIVAARSRSVEKSKGALTEHVQSYNECVRSKNPNYDRLPPRRAIALMVGYDNSSSSFVNKLSIDLSSNLRFLAGGPLNDKSFLQVGADATFRNYMQSNTLGLFVGAYYNSNSYSQSNKLNVAGYGEYNEYTIKFSQIKIPLGVEFMPITRSKLSFHIRAGVILSKTFGLKSTHPVYYIESDSDGQIYSQTPARLSSYDAPFVSMGAIGFDYKITDSHKVRLQFGYSAGKVKAAVETENDKFVVNGKFNSLNVMAGFVF